MDAAKFSRHGNPLVAMETCRKPKSTLGEGSQPPAVPPFQGCRSLLGVLLQGRFCGPGPGRRDRGGWYPGGTGALRPDSPVSGARLEASSRASPDCVCRPGAAHSMPIRGPAPPVPTADRSPGGWVAWLRGATLPPPSRSSGSREPRAARSEDSPPDPAAAPESGPWSAPPCCQGTCVCGHLRAG